MYWPTCNGNVLNSGLSGSGAKPNIVITKNNPNQNKGIFFSTANSCLAVTPCYYGQNSDPQQKRFDWK